MKIVASKAIFSARLVAEWFHRYDHFSEPTDPFWEFGKLPRAQLLTDFQYQYVKISVKIGASKAILSAQL